jgi:hypothetical protein
MELSERDVEKIARAYRETIYGKVTDENGWQNCKEHWVKDVRVFLAKLAQAGLEIVVSQPITKASRPVVDERGGGRHG